MVYDLLECLHTFLDNAGLVGVPVYMISPVAKSSLSLANIYAEWWVWLMGVVSSFCFVSEGCVKQSSRRSINLSTLSHTLR